MASRTSSALVPLDDDDLLAEILLLLPPKPSSLPRASLVCRRWRSITSDAAFRRRFRTHHRKPPIHGVFEQRAAQIKFTPLLDPPDRIPSERLSLDLGAERFGWRPLGCRHGRVLLISPGQHMLMVFEPFSGDTLRIPIPPEFVREGFTVANAAVLCAAGDDHDHVHGDCHTSPFKVVVIGTREQQQQQKQPALACIYSSETGIWGDVASTAEPCTSTETSFACILMGTALYCRLHRHIDGILKFDLVNCSLTLIKTPVVPSDQQYWTYSSHIIRAEDGGLGLAILSHPSFQLWDRKVDCHGVFTWVLRKDVNMDELLGPDAHSADIAGYDEDNDAICITMHEAADSDPCRYALVIVQLEPMKVEIHRGSFFLNFYHPFTSF